MICKIIQIKKKTLQVFSDIYLNLVVVYQQNISLQRFTNGKFCSHKFSFAKKNQSKKYLNVGLRIEK